MSIFKIFTMFTENDKVITSDHAGDKYKTIRAGNITFAQGYECEKCGLIRDYTKENCICNKNE